MTSTGSQHSSRDDAGRILDVEAPSFAKETPSIPEMMEFENSLFEHLRRNIEQYGIGVMGIFPTENDPGEPFCYTVGMQEVGQPEVIIFGLPPQVGQTILNDLCIPIVKDGGVLEAGRVDGLLANDVPLMLIEADQQDAAEYVTLSAAYRKVESVPVMQLVWPDAQGRWPWEHDSQTTQTLLGEPPA